MSLAATYKPKDYESTIYDRWQLEEVGKPESQLIVGTKPAVLFATTNEHKIQLFKLAWKLQGLNKQYNLLLLSDFDTSSLPEVVEDSGSFEGDALKKAIIYAKHFNLPTISQDRGFELIALGGWPGTASKKEIFGSEQIVFTNNYHQDNNIEDDIQRANSILDKITGKDRNMKVVQGLAIALPDGTSISDKYETLGTASKYLVTRIGASFDWFFIPDKLGHVLAEFESRELLDIYQAKEMYPITSKIVDFLEQSRTYSILMPPPNLTGDLHAGHAFQHYMMDTLTRIHRQKNRSSLWYPGVDHAGIQLEGVIDKLIKKGDFDNEIIKENKQFTSIPVADRPKWLKVNNPELWSRLAWTKVNEWRNNQQNQSSVLGDTPSYDRSLFTLDQRATQMVNYAFKKYWQDDLIYKGSYLINWSVGLQTAVSDVAGEIEYQKRIDPFVTFEYEVEEIIYDRNNPEFSKLRKEVIKLANSLIGKRIKVSTVRPETIFGDVAVAVHPKRLSRLFSLESFPDEIIGGFESLINNKTATVILTNSLNKQVELIIAEEVDADFGTGALKITPGSDIADYIIFNKYSGGSFPSAVGRDGRLTDISGQYAGLTVEQGRLAVIKDLILSNYIPIKTKEGIVTKNLEYNFNLISPELDQFDATKHSYTEGVKRLQEVLSESEIEYEIDWSYEHNVTICERSKTVIEPLISEEFFLSYHNQNTNLQQMGLQALEETSFYPADIKERAKNFLENINDWCISRDLVWGHKMPIWYNLDLNPNKNFYSYLEYSENTEIQKLIKVQDTKPTELGTWVQEEKILDTWFSSCLWPLSTLGYYDYIQGETNTDFKKYYPTSDLVSGVDIFYQWIVRMMLVCKYFTGQTPYKNVILNPTVRDEQGRKMSKSLGNGLDAVKQIDKYSSDSLRLAMLSGMIPNRNFRLGGRIADQMCEKYRNFGNKLWNVARFLEYKEESLNNTKS